MKIVKVVKSKDQTILSADISDGVIWEFRCCLDPEKMHAYEKFFKKYAKGKVIADLGTGPGIMGYLALKYGAKKVYFIDHHPQCVSIAYLLTQDFKDRERSFHTIDLRYDDLSFMSDVDIAIHEIFGHNIYDEFIKEITYNFQKHKLNKKLVPIGVEWYEIKNKKLTDYNSSRADYIASNFPEGTREFHELYKKKVEDFNDSSKYDRMIVYKNIEDAVWNKIGETNLTEYDLCDWVPEELSVYKSDKTEKVYSWAAKLDGDISYRGPGRDLNNWMLMPGDNQHQRRFVSAVRFGRSINPYHGDI